MRLEWEEKELEKKEKKRPARLKLGNFG